MVMDEGQKEVLLAMEFSVSRDEKNDSTDPKF